MVTLPKLGGKDKPPRSVADRHGSNRRRYRSPLRAEQAAGTRARIATAALELFAERGFTATSVASIAKRAGVSAQSVYAVYGTKGAVLAALLAGLEDNADANGWRERIAAEHDPARKLEAFARWTTTILSTSKDVIAAANGAAGDPAIVELRAEADRHRRQALEALVAALDAGGALRPGLSVGRAVDRAWMLTGVELYLAATTSCGWTDLDYTEWLGALLVDQLLAP